MKFINDEIIITKISDKIFNVPFSQRHLLPEVISGIGLDFSWTPILTLGHLADSQSVYWVHL